MPAPTLHQPLLLGTAWSAPINGVEALSNLLSQQYKIVDLEPIAQPLATPGPLTLQAASVMVGEVSLVSVLGQPLSLEVEPLHALCMVALPSVGWGQYQLDDHKLDNTVGHSVAYLPPVGWRLINNSTGGTALQFAQEALIRRILSISGCTLSAGVASALLSLPFVVSTSEGRPSYYYRQLLAALSLFDNSFRHGPGAPDPMLNLDDLIMRCLALLLYPPLAAMADEAPRISRYDLNKTIDTLMDWMQSNLHRPITLTEVEQRTQYGRRAIQLGFKAKVGCGPMQWLRRQRLDLALSLLKSPGAAQSVTQVAHSCGYLSLASFSRDFRARYGVSARGLFAQSQSRLPLK
ncbi:MAG: helix-turn-helix transcriptional regulator [Cyanobacteria bacterium M_surface_9_m1_291]|nr:helix-turn-helix transcriptional regulator [Cyanobacteria bacterium M_surface_9_m1_291]